MYETDYQPRKYYTFSIQEEPDKEKNQAITLEEYERQVTKQKNYPNIIKYLINFEKISYLEQKKLIEEKFSTEISFFKHYEDQIPNEFLKLNHQQKSSFIETLALCNPTAIILDEKKNIIYRQKIITNPSQSEWSRRKINFVLNFHKEIQNFSKLNEIRLFFYKKILCYSKNLAIKYYCYKENLDEIFSLIAQEREGNRNLLYYFFESKIGLKRSNIEGSINELCDFIDPLDNILAYDKVSLIRNLISTIIKLHTKTLNDDEFPPKIMRELLSALRLYYSIKEFDLYLESNLMDTYTRLSYFYNNNLYNTLNNLNYINTIKFHKGYDLKFKHPLLWYMPAGIRRIIKYWELFYNDKSTEHQEEKYFDPLGKMIKNKKKLMSYLEILMINLIDIIKT